MIEQKIAKATTKTDLKWVNWLYHRDSVKEDIREFVDTKLRAHTLGKISFDVADNQFFLALRPRRIMPELDYLVFFETKENGQQYIAVKDGAVVPRGTMMFAFATIING